MPPGLAVTVGGKGAVHGAAVTVGRKGLSVGLAVTVGRKEATGRADSDSWEERGCSWTSQ